jgi:hypothetical protein
MGGTDRTALRCKLCFETRYHYEIPASVGHSVVPHNTASQFPHLPIMLSGLNEATSAKLSAQGLTQTNRGFWGLGSGPERALPGPPPRRLGSESLPGPPCCCIPPRSCPAPGESVYRAARSSSWRRRSRALHTCKSPSVCRAGTWWRLGRRAGRSGSGLRRAGRESGGKPSLGPRGPKEGGVGVGQELPGPQAGPRQQTTTKGPDPQFQTSLGTDNNHLPFGMPPRPLRTEATRPPQR